MGNQYLISDYPLIVLPALAVAIGLNRAIVLQQVHYLLGKLEGKSIEGKRWIFMPEQEWAKQFPFWSANTIRNTVKSLVTDVLHDQLRKGRSTSSQKETQETR